MTRSIKPVFLCLFAAVLCGCPEKTQISGRVIDLQGPVANARVLGMVWIEDAATAKPGPNLKDLKGEALDAAYEQDMKDRGLPVAYARGMADGQGWFTLDKLNFSSKTKKAVNAMKQPVVTRVSVWAFGRGYLKRAITAFPKPGEELPVATMLVFKPADWKELYRENTVNSIAADYMVRAYSKEFGATKAEKSWILEYAQSNLWQAYTQSEVVGDKEAKKLCGHDYNNVIITKNGMQRDPNHEKCAELLQRMGEVRDVEGIWMAHSRTSDDAAGSEKELVHIALAALPSGITEPKSYESAILAGVDNALQEKNAGQINLQNEAAGNTEVAQNIYNKGGKAEAYQMLGRTLYGKFLNGSEDLQVAELDARIVPGIRESIAVYYQLMNRPLTAQLVSSGSSSTRTDATNNITEKSTGTIKVKDYESFQKYVAELDKKVEAKSSKQEESLKIEELEKWTKYKLSNGKILTVKSGLGLVGNKVLVTGYPYSQQERVKKGFFYGIDVYDLSGTKLFEVPCDGDLSIHSVHWINDKLYLFTTNRGIDPGPKAKDGFFIYDASGNLLKFFEINWIDHAFSQSGKYLAVVAGFEGDRKDITKPSMLIVYEADTNEYWREVFKTPVLAAVSDNEVSFSRDDKYVMLNSRGGDAIVDYNEVELQSTGKGKIYARDRKAKGATYIFDLTARFKLISKERR